VDEQFPEFPLEMEENKDDNTANRSMASAGLNNSHNPSDDDADNNIIYRSYLNADNIFYFLWYSVLLLLQHQLRGQDPKTTALLIPNQELRHMLLTTQNNSVWDLLRVIDSTELQNLLERQ